MPQIRHNKLEGDDLHPIGYIGSTNPGDVGSGKTWLDTNEDPPTLKIRNESNTDWLPIQGVATNVIPTVDKRVSGELLEVPEGESLDIGDVCKIEFSSGNAIKSNASNIGDASTIIMRTNEEGVFLIKGFIKNTDWSLSEGLVFLSTSDGEITQDPPSGEDEVIQILGKAITENTIYFKPELIQLELE